MDPNTKKRMAAAIAAVYRYLRSQEEQQLAMVGMTQEIPGLTMKVPSLWSVSGRQATMEMRRLLQLRMVR
ncbi:MAG: hypothetical protein JSU72_13185 [Deltaproteobacteria bacterium]|nr:MAG: hypothetical protein JSU72_13185 [Deltaproteobacteria bacterium]